MQPAGNVHAQGCLLLHLMLTAQHLQAFATAWIYPTLLAVAGRSQYTACNSGLSRSPEERPTATGGVLMHGPSFGDQLEVCMFGVSVVRL